MKELVREAKASKRTWRFGRAAPAVGADDDDDAVTGQHNRLFGVGAGEDDVSFEAFALAALDERARRRAEDNDSVARTGSRRSSQSSRRRVRRSVRSELAEEAKAELEQRREQARIAAVSERNPVLARVFNALDVEQRGALDLEQLVLLLSEMCVPVDVAEVMNRAEVVADWHAMGRRKARRRAYREGREMRFLQVRHAKRVFRFERERKREREKRESKRLDCSLYHLQWTQRAWECGVRHHTTACAVVDARLCSADLWGQCRRAAHTKVTVPHRSLESLLCMHPLPPRHTPEQPRRAQAVPPACRLAVDAVGGTRCRKS